RGLRPTVARAGRAEARRGTAAAGVRGLRRPAAVRNRPAGMRRIDRLPQRRGAARPAAGPPASRRWHPLPTRPAAGPAECGQRRGRWGLLVGGAPAGRGSRAMSADPPRWDCPAPGRDGARVLLAHGEGMRLTRRLIRDVMLAAFDNPLLRPLADGATLPPIRN